MNTIRKVLLSLCLIFALLFAFSCKEEEPLTYEEFAELSGQEQREYFDTFASIEDFFVWYEEARAAYIAAHPDADMGDLDIDFGAMDEG